MAQCFHCSIWTICWCMTISQRTRRLTSCWLRNYCGSTVSGGIWFPPGMKMVWIFSDRIRDRIRLEGFKFIRIRVRIFNIRYRIRIRIPKSYIYDVDIQMYHIRHGWYYPYSNSNPGKNTKTNVISAISDPFSSLVPTVKI
jgi:hypothetical protein